MNRVDRLGQGAGRANVAGQSASLLLEITNGEIRAIGAIGQILADPLLKSAAVLALRNVDKIMQNQFAIVPGIGPNDQSMTKAYATSVFRNDTGASRRRRQTFVIGQGNSIYHQDPDSGNFVHAGANGIFDMARTKWHTAGQHVIFLRPRPLIGEVR